MSNTNFSTIFQSLQEPFASNLIEWKPQAVSADKKRALAAAYVDMREYEDRLDQVFPQWTSSVQFLVTDRKVAAIVSLTIDGVTRVNVGEASLEDENSFTSSFAQAFKRACSDFGLGRYLYRLPQKWCDYDEKQRAIIAPPQLPDWAKPSSERQAAKEAEARQRVAAEMPAPEATVVEGAQTGEYGKEENVGEFVIPSVFKKHGGMRLKNIPRKSIEWYANEMPASSPAAKLLQEKAKAYLAKYPV
jgi:hypothetical protein